MCSKLSPITHQAWLLITEEASRLTCGCVELSFSASTILQRSQPDGSLTSYVKPAFPNVCGYPSAAVWLNSSASSLQGDSRWSVGKAGVTDTQTGSQMESTGVPSHSPAGGSVRGSSRPRGTLSITSFLFPCFCFSSVAEILTLASTHTHICTCTLICSYYQVVWASG